MQWPSIPNRFAIPTAFLALVISATPTAADTISGVCPDGSIFIVQRRSAVPCEEAKQVHPSDIPPLNPELLPRPYGWQLFQDRQNPNNPYNVVDSAPSMRPLNGPRMGSHRREGPRDWVRRPQTSGHGLVPQTSPPSGPMINRNINPITADRAKNPVQTARATPPSVLATAGVATSDAAPFFPERDLRDLALIVELSQRRAPATFWPRGRGHSSGANGMTVRIAYSASFEPRLRALFQERGGLPAGKVLLFSVVASEPQPFFGNLTFVQGGAVYHPNRDEPRDLGVLSSELGMIGNGEALLGYTRLPEAMDLTREIDIYWNDRLLSTILNPT